MELNEPGGEVTKPPGRFLEEALKRRWGPVGTVGTVGMWHWDTLNPSQVMPPATRCKPSHGAHPKAPTPPLQD